MRAILACVALLCVTGCLGVAGGGSTYRVDMVRPDGVKFSASADTVQASETVTLDFEGNPLTGDIKSMRFSKTGVTQGVWSNELLSKSLDRIQVAP